MVCVQDDDTCVGCVWGVYLVGYELVRVLTVLDEVEQRVDVPSSPYRFVVRALFAT